MLTVDYDRLGLKPGHLILDLGAGGGRHAYGALQRGARVVALDYSAAEVKDAVNLMKAMIDAGDDGPGHGGTGVGVNGDALALPYADNTFDRVICSEVMEHIPDDLGAMRELYRVLKVGATAAITVPRWGPELVCWALSDRYHMTPGGHVRIYRQNVLEERLRTVGLTPVGVGRAHGLHTPYWWIKCAVGVDNADHPVVKAFHDVLVADMARPRPLGTRLAEAALNPVLSKSIVIYVEKRAA